MKIKVIFIQHGFGKYPEAIAHVKKLVKNLQGDELEVDLEIFDTSLTENCYSSLVQHDLNASSNIASEFSGFQAGILSCGDEYSGCLFVTSAFKYSHENYISLMESGVIKSAISNSFAVGHIDAYPERIHFFGYAESAWLRTAYFFLPLKIIKSLSRVDVVPDEFDKIFGSHQYPFSDTEYISENFKGYLLGWLTGVGKKIEINSTWHSEFFIDEANYAYFKRKIKSIILEKILTARIKSLGYAVLDVEYIKSSGRIDYDNFDNQIAELRWYRKVNGPYC